MLYNMLAKKKSLQNYKKKSICHAFTYNLILSYKY